MLITVRAAVIIGAAFVVAISAVALMLLDGKSWPAALMVAAAAFGATLIGANAVIG